jgi:hypothetical protein
MVATADQIVAKGGRLELRVESQQEILEALEAEEDRFAMLKTFSERARIDKKAGLRFNVMEFDGGILRALGLVNKDGSDTEIYIRGPYVQGKPGVGFMIRF